MPVSPRLVLVRRCVETLWSTRYDGRWSALEDALIVVLDPKKLPDRRVGPRRNNVILLSDYLERRQLADRRKNKPP